MTNACYMADLIGIDRRIDKRNVDYQNLQKGIIPCGSKYRLNRLNGTLTDGNGSKSRFNQERYKFFLDADFEISDRCCNVMKKEPAHTYYRKTGRKPILATMASESWLRTQKWLQNGCNGFNLTIPTSTPMSFWTEQDVLWYIKENNLPICSVYGEIVVDYDAMGQCENQMTFSDYGIFGEERPLLKTTGCNRTGCVLCGFGIHMEKRPHRFDLLRERNEKEWRFWMYDIGWGHVLDYIGVEWETPVAEQMRL